MSSSGMSATPATKTCFGFASEGPLSPLPPPPLSPFLPFPFPLPLPPKESPKPIIISSSSRPPPRKSKLISSLAWLPNPPTPPMPPRSPPSGFLGSEGKVSRPSPRPTTGSSSQGAESGLGRGSAVLLDALPNPALSPEGSASLSSMSSTPSSSSSSVNLVENFADVLAGPSSFEVSAPQNDWLYGSPSSSPSRPRGSDPFV
mmetsp:Transcript_9632/g.21494  ORF Transcript_9632/g.21494 Transcript_9632/m.21494 type:complete len:202 (+) Transcript_9632:871-1476(+)